MDYGHRVSAAAPPSAAQQQRIADVLQVLEALEARMALSPLQATLNSDEVPCFAHLRVHSHRQGSEPRDVFLGQRTLVQPGLTVLDWQTAPLASVFFSCEEGEDYELEHKGRPLAGTLLQRNLLSFVRGALCEIRTRDAVLRRRGTAWEALPLPPLRMAGLRERPEGARHASPVEVPLDAAQRAVVDLPAGQSVLVLGEAGCGKTTVALHRLARLLRERPQRAALIVPTEGLRRFAEALLERLLAGSEARVEVLMYDRFAAEQARRSFTELPKRESLDSTAGILRFKRHPALQVGLQQLARKAKLPRARWRDLLHLYGDTAVLGRVMAAARSGPYATPQSAGVEGRLSEASIKELVEHTKIQFGVTAELQWKGTDEERLQAVDGTALDLGTPTQDVGSIDVEDYAVLFELDKLKAAALGQEAPRPRPYDCLMIDEAQELAPLELRLIGRSLAPGGSLVVAGDEGQQVDPTAFFSDWSTTLNDLGMGERAAHQRAVLSVSYRSPPEVTALARRILPRQQTALPVGQALPAPVSAEPDPEHPRVLVQRVETECHLIALLGDALRELRARDPRASIAVIGRNPAAAKRLAQQLAHSVDLHLALGGDFRLGHVGFEAVLHVSCVEEVKGLEFDYVFVPDATAAAYPDTPEARRALYVAVTRTVEQLALLSVGRLSPLLA